VYGIQALGVGWQYDDIPPYGRHTAGFASTLKFDLGSQTAGRTLTKATLRLRVSTIRQDFAITPQILVNAFTGDWNPATLTWNNCMGLGIHTPGEVQAAAPSTVGSLLDFDVTTIVRNWASGAWANYGLRLWVNQHPDPGGRPSVGTTYFDSLETASEPIHRPQLIIEYQ
jgi:hypothetical protein